MTLDDWIRGYAAQLAPAPTRGLQVRWVTAPSGARLAFVEGAHAVAKLHHSRTDPQDLAKRLAAVGDARLAPLFVQPLSGQVATAPDGRLVTWWPVVEVLGPDSPEIPWARAGELLASLHSADPPPGLPRHGALERLQRAAAKAAELPPPERRLLAPLADRLVREAAEVSREREPAQRHTPRVALCHGDFHLGQLGRQGTRWQLLDVDDVGLGDPAWDLARLAGFWAAGLLDDASWQSFLAGYGVSDDPWPWLDLPARCAVLVAAVREAGVQRAHRGHSAEALLDACRRM